MSRSARGGVSAALAIVAAVAMHNWILSPHLSYLHAMQQYQPVIEGMVEEENAIRQSLEGKRLSLEAAIEKRAELLARFFDPIEAKAFLESLQSTIETAGCSVEGIDLAGSAPAGQPTHGEEALKPIAYRATFDITGHYGQIVELLNCLQAGQQDVWMDTFEIELQDIRSAQLTCRIGLVVYVVASKEDLVDG
jgi:hypothetical protein